MADVDCNAVSDDSQGKKVCFTCREDLPLDAFAETRQFKKGASCKQCVREYNRAYHEKHREKQIAHSRAYYQANKDKVLAANRKWFEENPGKAAEYSRVFRANNPEKTKAQARTRYTDPVKREKVLAYGRKRYQEKKEYFFAHTRNRRAKILGLEGRHTGNDIQRLFDLQKGKCAICRVPIIDGYHVDHIMPIAKGGGNGSDNLQLLCASCNRSKSTKDPIEFMQANGFLL